MAEIRLDRQDADGGLPDICMCCGAKATVTKTRNMSWYPPWVNVLLVFGVLPAAIAAMILTKKARLQAPLCDQHKGHWFKRGLLVGGAFVLFALIGLAGCLLTVALQPRVADDVAPFACVGGVVLFLAWLIVLVIAQNTAIRPKKITDTEIVLQGVSSEFVDAFEELESERRAQRRKRRQQRDDEDEEDEEPRPRKKSAPSDGIQEKKRRAADDEFEDQPRPRKKRPPADDDS